MLRVARLVLDRAGRLPLRIGVNRGAGVHRRLRAAVPPDVLGQGRRGQPRRPGDGQGRTRPGCSRPRTRSSARRPRFDDRAAAAVHGQGQVAARSGGQRRAPSSGQRPMRSVDDLPLVGRERRAGRRSRGLVDGRARARAGWSSSSASPASASPGWSRSCCATGPTTSGCVAGACDEYESSTPYFPFRRCCARCSVLAADAGAGRRSPTGWSTPSTASAPQLLPWLPLLGVPLDLRAAGDAARPRELDEQFRKARLEEVVRATSSTCLAADHDGARSSRTRTCMDDASADLLAQARRAGIGDRPWLVLVTRGTWRPASYPDRATTSSRVRPRAAAVEGGARPGARRRRGPPAAATTRSTRPGRAQRRQPDVPRGAGARGRPVRVGRTTCRSRSRGSSPARSTGSTRPTAPSCATPRCSGWSWTRTPWAAVARPRTRLGDDDCAVGEQPAALRRLGGFFVQEQADRLRFRHALMRDVAYEGLPYSRRKLLHEQVGRGHRSLGRRPRVPVRGAVPALLPRRTLRPGLARTRVLAGDPSQGEVRQRGGDRLLRAGRRVGPPRCRRCRRPQVAARCSSQLGDVRELTGSRSRRWRRSGRPGAAPEDDPVAVANLMFKEAKACQRQGKVSAVAGRAHPRDGTAGGDTTPGARREQVDASRRATRGAG